MKRHRACPRSTPAPPDVTAPRRAIARAVMAAVVMLGASSLGVAHESPVDHVNRQMQLWVAGGRLFVRYRIELTDRMAMMQLMAADLDGDGTVNDAEREALLRRLRERMRAGLRLEIAGQAVAWDHAEPVRLDARFGQTCVFATPVPANVAEGVSGQLSDESSREYPGAFRYLRRAEVPAGATPVHVEDNDDGMTAPGNHATAMMVLRFRWPAVSASGATTRPAATRPVR